MARVLDIVRKKDGDVFTIAPTATVLDAAREMNAYGIGALVVEEHGRVVGIFTERDVLRRVIAAERDPATTCIEEVMTREVICCSPETLVDEARGAMRSRRIRHLPIATEDGSLVGLVSIGDLNAELQAAQEQTLFLLNEYICGRA